MPNIHILGRRWSSRTYGTTYCTATIFVDGKQVHKTPKEYGPGDCYLQSAVDWLKANGHAPADARGNTLYMRETLGATYDVSDVARERDL